MAALLSAGLVAGTTAAAVVIPQAMGYATVAGLPVQVGLYTCIVPMVVYALMGGARRLSISTTSTIVALVALALTATGASGDGALVGAVATLTLLVGLFLLLFRLLRLGWIVEAVSEATITGLKSAVAFTIIADQLPELLGTEPADGGFAADVTGALRGLGEAHTITVVLAAATLAGLFALRRWVPRFPGPLAALALGVTAAWALSLADRGVALIPAVPTGLPAPALPSLDQAATLLPFALAISLMSYFESVTAARVSRKADDPPLDNDQEYVAVGAATLIGSLFQTLPPAGGLSQTQVNTDAGARTQVSELVTAAWGVAIALLPAPLLGLLPEAVLGAVVVVAVSGLISVPALVRLWRIDRVEFAVAVVTGLIALGTDLLVGVAVGVLLTFYLVLRALNHPVVTELRRPAGEEDLLPARPGDPAIPGLLVLRIEGGLYTLNVRRVQEEILRRVDAADPRPEVLLLDAARTGDTSVTVMDAFAETDQALARHGTRLWVADLPARALEKAQRTAAWSQWAAAGRLHTSPRRAVEAFERTRHEGTQGET
ncbi:SulP family inorganic anion transporter [Nocardiopsis protaetiae]|uniref:SulP family inorganic anion transporter n=1 Tax=Nocardiopsis protaetiae TaxID=3382270 RepID=UPI00387B257A